jgi:hypothetical protein
MQLDSTPLIHRLAATGCFFNKMLGQRNNLDKLHLYVDLRENPVCQSRDLQVMKVSELIQSIISPQYQPTNLCLKLISYGQGSQYNKKAHVYLISDRQLNVILDADIVPDVLSTCTPLLSNLRHISFRVDDTIALGEPHPPKMKSVEYRIGKDEFSVELPWTGRTGPRGWEDSKYAGVFVLRKDEILDGTGIQMALGRYFDIVPTLDCVELRGDLRIITLY